MKIFKSNSIDRPSVSIVIFKIVTIILAIAILFPYVWLVSTSLLTREEFYSSSQPFFSSSPQWGRYYTVLIEQKFYRSIVNSIMLAGIGVLQNIFISPFVAYGLSRFRFKGRYAVFICILSTMFLPAQVTSIPKFLFYKRLGWLYTYLPLIVPGFFGAATSILFTMSFMKIIPREMDEAAKIDGCNHFRIWLFIIMPQLIPVLCLLGLNTFIGHWKNSYAPMIYLRDPDMFTVPLTLLKFQTNDSLADVGRLKLYVALVIAIVPVAVLFLFLQNLMNKYVVVAELK
ncbi:MAG: carbohydrate ABC transporter permease [Clostridia bacterium]|nr:carbohydrate ABC transporter permease [Clostridia bacterium]